MPPALHTDWKMLGGDSGGRWRGSVYAARLGSSVALRGSSFKFQKCQRQIFLVAAHQYRMFICHTVTYRNVQVASHRPAEVAVSPAPTLSEKVVGPVLKDTDLLGARRSWRPTLQHTAECGRCHGHVALKTASGVGGGGPGKEGDRGWWQACPRLAREEAASAPWSRDRLIPEVSD